MILNLLKHKVLTTSFLINRLDSSKVDDNEFLSQNFYRQAHRKMNCIR